MVNKKTEEESVLDALELSKLVEKWGTALDNPPVNLDRASYVSGTISMGSLVIDLLTGGGLPPGKFTTMYGPPGSGKSTASYHIVSNALKQNIPVFFFDHEAGADSKYLASMGVRIREKDGKKNPLFNYFQPTTGESTYRLMAKILRSLPQYTPTADGSRPKPTALFVVDSLAAMLPEAYDQDEDNNQRAVTAKVHSENMPKVKARLGRANVSWFATNQLRMNPSAMFGNPEYQPGGQASAFYPDLSIRISSVKKPFLERNRMMKLLNISTKKNKQFVPFLEAKEMLAVAFGRGFERGRDALGYLTLTGQIKKTSGYRELSMEGVSNDIDWNNKKYRPGDLMSLVCTNEFREVCRQQLSSDVAFELYFRANDWESVYIDEEAATDEENLFDAATQSKADSIPAPESDTPEVSAKPAKRKKRKAPPVEEL